MNNTNNKLFDEFSTTSYDEWLEKVSKDLKGVDFDKKLLWKNLNGFDLNPYYTKENSTTESASRINNRPVINYRTVEVTDALEANKLAHQGVQEGIDGLIFEIKKEVSVYQLLDNIDLNSIAVSFKILSNPISFVKDLIAFAKAKNYINLSGFVDIGLISNYTTTGDFDKDLLKVAAELITITEDFQNFKVITISGVEFGDCGSNQVQEIAYTLNAMVFVIDELTEKNISAKNIFDNINFNLAIGSSYFIEIAKFRAFYNILIEIVKKYKVEECDPTLTAKTSIWNKSVLDAETNMLRATTETMSAVLGNVSGIVIDAYDSEYREASSFSNRIAGNIYTILKEESYFGIVSNPVDGAYYIEEVTDKIAENSLKLFQKTEELGGFYQAFENEIIQQAISEIRLKKLLLISQRRSTLVGVNKYPNLMEEIAIENLIDHKSRNNSKILIPQRASFEIEALRRKTEELVLKTKIRPVVQLVSFGDLNMRKARAAFAYDFIGVSGFDIKQEQSFENAEIAAKESAESNTSIVVMCSSDQDFEKDALNFIQIFRSISKDKVLILAGLPSNIDKLNEAGLDGIINLKTDIIQSISTIQEKVEQFIKA